MPPGYRGGRRGEDQADLGDHKLDTIIEQVERDVFERQELTNYKIQAKLLERQLEVEDTVIETILRLVINFAEKKILKK